MRSGWSPDAAFLALHNGHSSAHGHSDANSLVLTAFGNELLIDPGVYIYGTPELQLLASAVSHNTVTMDDRSAVNDRGEARWTSGRWFDIYDGTNAGYEGGPRRQRRAASAHRRLPQTDALLCGGRGRGDLSHDWTLRDHFAPAHPGAAPDGNRLPSARARDPAMRDRARGGLRVWSAAQDDTHLTRRSGLASGGWERKIEAPVATWSRFQSRKAIWLELWEPFPLAPSPTAWDVRQDENGIALAFQKQGRDRHFALVRTESDTPMPDSWTDATGF